MANYANSRGFAGAFNNLTGILNMFLQNQMNRSNIEDDRKYQDETYEKKLKDAIVTSMMNNAIKGNADLYETSLTGQGAARTITPQTVMGKTVSSAATPIETEDKITKINAGDFGRLRNNSIRYVPREDAISKKSNYMIPITENEARLLNARYKKQGVSYKAGNIVPYGLITSIGQGETAQQRLSYNLDKSDKEYRRRYITEQMKYALDTPSNGTKTAQEIMAELKESDPYFKESYEILYKTKNNQQQKKKTNNNLREQARAYLVSKGVNNPTEDDINRLIAAAQ